MGGLNNVSPSRSWNTCGLSLAARKQTLANALQTAHGVFGGRRAPTINKQASAATAWAAGG